MFLNPVSGSNEKNSWRSNTSTCCEDSHYHEIHENQSIGHKNCSDIKREDNHLNKDSW